MTLPAGIETATVTFGTDVDITGGGVSATMVATPTHDLVWAATGQRLLSFDVTVTVAPGVAGSIDLPVVDQSGFQDGAGNAYTMWAYTLVCTYRSTTATGRAPETKVVTKAFQPLSGQGTVDFDQIPDGTVASPVQAPQVNAVISVDGQTGKVDLSSSYARIFTPEAYGAKGDGTTDDRVALQDAVNAAGAGDVVWLRNVYACGVDTNKRGLYVKAGTRIAGPGTLKVLSGIGDFYALITTTDSTVDASGVIVEDITIDANYAGNPLVTASSLSANPRVLIALYKGDDITVRNVTVENHTGTNTIYVSGTATGRLTVRDCKFLNTGQAPANQGHDHSTLYLEAVGIEATGNTFTAASPLGAHAAIETHGPSQVVTGNDVTGYCIVGNITGVQSADGDNVVVTGNIGRNVMAAFALYSASTLGGTGMRNLTLTGNNVTIDRDAFLPYATQGTGIQEPFGVYLSADSDLPLTDVDISHNNISVLPYSAAAALSSEELAAGVLIYRTVTPTGQDVRVRIESNTLVNFPGPGIRYSSSCDQLRIRGNTIIDAGGSNSSSQPAPFRSGIILTAGTFNDCDIADNITIDTRATHLMTAPVDVSTVAAVTNGRIMNNGVRCADGTDLYPSFASGTGTAFYVEHFAATWAGIFQPVKPGSWVQVAADGKRHINTNATDGGAPTFVSITAGQVAADSNNVVAATGPVGTLTDKLAVWDSSGTSVVGWVPVYSSIT